MAIYERFSGGQVAERVRTIPGTEEAEQFAALAEEPTSGWRCAVPDEEPQKEQDPAPLERPANSASKRDWVSFAVAQGLTAEEAEKATRDELAARYAEGGDGDAADQ